MVEVKLNFVGGGFVTGELELFDEVFVGHLGESAAFVGVEVDVVNIERGGGKVFSTTNNGLVTEFEVDLDFVVLEGNEGKGKTGVAAEPELKGNENNVVGNVSVSGWVFGEGVATVHHKLVTIPVTGGLGKFVPHVEPVSVVLVDTLATDFNFNGLDKLVTSPFGRGGRGTEISLKVDTVDEITISGDRAGNLLAVVGETVESLFNRFHGEVGVSAVDNLEESDLRVARKIDILSTISDELHKTSSHFVFLFNVRKKFIYLKFIFTHY